MVKLRFDVVAKSVWSYEWRNTRICTRSL